jgi:hypothetical protein
MEVFKLHAAMGLAEQKKESGRQKEMCCFLLEKGIIVFSLRDFLFQFPAFRRMR